MKIFSRLFFLSFAFILTTAFSSVNGDDDEVCANAKKITAAFNDKNFDKLKGKDISDQTTPGDKQYLSAIELKGYISQLFSETESQVYFSAVLNQDFDSEQSFRKAVEKVATSFERCLGVQMEYGERRSSIFYSFVYESGVEVKIAGNYVYEKRRYITFDVSLNKQ